jgi:arylsulfatase A-like enzyme
MLLMRVPGMTRPGGRSRRCVSLQDLYPTLVELCGLSKPSHVDGKSLVPLLKDPEAEWESTAISYLYDRYASIRTERFRFTRYREGQVELYDHSKDPHEWTNEAANSEYAELVRDLEKRLPPIDEMAPQLVRGRK